MGDIELLPQWEEVELENINKELSLCKSFKYYKRLMKNENACIKSYYAHLFICQFDDNKQLSDGWRKINNIVAVRFQSKISEVMERSNFYICYFVQEEIDMQLRNEIETDPFSAKKYVYDGRGMSLNEYNMMVEDRIFAINIVKSDKSTLKLASLQMHNFRAYEGDMTMGLQDKNGKPASFVAIYAKNGVGKTSLFDGIEYVLKGEVSRLDALSDKEEGPIYHNRKKEQERAFASLTLENNIVMQRNVANIQPPYNGKNDCRRNTPVKGEGKEIIESSNQWGQIILPHHKIDSFISDKKATEQYKDWIKDTEALSQEQSGFVTAYKLQKENDKNIETLLKQYQELEKQRKDLEGKEEDIKKIRELVDKFNKFDMNDQLVFNGQETTEDEYNSLINKANIIKRRIKTDILPSIENRIKVAKKILSVGVETYQSKLSQFDNVRTNLEKKENRIVRRNEYDGLSREKQNIEKQIEDTNLSLIPINKIEKFGEEEVFKNKRIYKETQEKLPDLRETVKGYDIKVKTLEEEINRIMLHKNTQEKLLEDKKLYDEILKIVTEYDQYHRAIINIEAQLLQSLKVQQDLMANKKKQEQVLKKIEELSISEKITGYNVQSLSIINLIYGEELSKSFDDIYSRYQKELFLLKDYQIQKKKREENNDELEQLLDNAREYILKHHEIKECPLCHSPYDNWEKLFQKVNVIHKDNNDLMNEQLEKVSKAIESLTVEYQAVYRKYLEIKQIKIKNKQDEIAEIVGDIEKEYNNYQEKNTDKEDYSSKCILLIETLKQREVVLSSYSVDGVELWYSQYIDALKNSIENDEKSVKDCKKQASDLSENIKKAEDQINQLNKAQNDIINNSELFSIILFILRQPDNYNFTESAQKIKEQHLTQIKAKEEIDRKIKDCQDVISTDLSKCIGDRDREKELFNEINEIKKECEILPDLSEDKVSFYLQTWETEQEQLSSKWELLEQICEESGARDYFKLYINIQEAITETQQKYNIALEEKKIVKNQFDASKEVLEEALHKYFNQTYINEIYRKIDPHAVMKSVDYKLSFNDKDEPELCIQVKDSEKGEGNTYRPEWYFSTAQLNTVAFSSFFSKAIMSENIPISTIFIDDPIGSFDDMNILGFADLMRSILECTKLQIIMSTHDEKVYNILERKLNPEFYSSAFITLPSNPHISWNR